MQAKRPGQDGAQNGAGYLLGDLDIPGPNAQRRPPPPAPQPPRAAPPPRPAAPAASAYGELDLDLAPPAQAPRAAPAASAYGELDLDFGLDGPAPSKPLATPGVSGVADFGARDFDGDFGASSGGDLSLELADDPRPPAPRAAAQPASLQAAATTQLPLTPALKKPVLSTQEAAEAFTREAQELRDLAGFGDTPDGFVGCARYALQVGYRLIVLQRETKRVKQHAEAATEQYHAALAELGRALLPKANEPAFHRFAALYSAVQAAGAAVQRADQSLSQAQAEAAAQRDALSQKRASIEAELAPLRDNECEADQAHKQASEKLRRAQALEKRVEIEMRALSDASVEVDQQKLEALKAQLAERRQSAAAVLVETEAAQANLARAQQACAQKRREIRAVEEEHEKLESTARAQASAIGNQAQSLNRAHQDALRALSEAVITAELLPQGLPQIEGVVRAQGPWRESQLSLDRYERARKLYHRKSVIKGALLWVALVVLGLVALSIHSAPSA